MDDRLICKWSNIADKIGTPEEIVKALHYYLDWVRACNTRHDNKRIDNEELLITIQKGLPLTKKFDTHYVGD